MSIFITWGSLLVISVFLAFFVILFFMIKMYENYLLKSEFYCSERTSLVEEVLTKLPAVKTEAAEGHFKEKIHLYRHKEIHTLHQAANQQLFSYFVMSLAPMIAILVVIIVDLLTRRRDFFYIIVSIVTTMHKQFKKFLNVADQYHHFDNAIRHFNNFYFVIPNKTKSLRAGK
jgi:ABC-type multidrug transport system fused ATPase/permease subunit